MRMLDEQELEVIQKGAPEIFEMVDKAQKDNVDVVLLTIDAFGAKEEAELLQNVIWYVTQSGLNMTFVRKSE